MDFQDMPSILASAVIIGMAGYGIAVMFPAMFSAFAILVMPLVVIIIAGCGAWHYVFQADYGPAQTEARTYTALLPKPIQDMPQPPHDNLENILNHEVVQDKGDKKEIINIRDSVIIKSKIGEGEDEN